jgi:hypothetical protein
LQALNDETALREKEYLFVTEWFKQSALREWPTEVRYWILGWMLGSLICVVVGPMGTDQLSVIKAVPYWFGINGVATTIMFGVLRIFNTTKNRNFAFVALLGSFVFSLIFSPILILVNRAVFDVDMGFVSFVSNFTIALLIFAIVWAAITWRGPEKNTTLPKFENRLSKYQTAQLWAVSAQDHYLQVVTDEGSEMILMRLGDAMAELTERDGIKIHRSHWVARSGVAKSSSTQIILNTGDTLPISRQNAAAVKAFFA